MTLFVSSQRLRRLVLTAMCVGGLTVVGLAQAQSWPQKPIRVIVNFPPGGAADQIARAVAQPLGEALGQSVVVENRGGANGNIGGEAVAKSAADGHTLLMSSGGMVSINPHLYNKMPFDPMKDLVPVAAAARVLVFLEVRPGLQINDFKTFLDFVKANPGKLSFGSPGNGSSPHLAAEMMKAQSQTFAVHVPYRGAAPAMQDLLGLKGFDADSWFGFYAPAGTPVDVVQRLNREINAALNSPAVRDRIQALGGIPAPMSAADFGQSAKTDSERFGQLIKSRTIRGD